MENNKKKQYEITDLQANLIMIVGMLIFAGILFGNAVHTAILGVIGVVVVPLVTMKIRKEKK